MDVAFKRMVEEPLAMIPPEPTVVGKPSEPESGEQMDAEPSTAKDASIPKEKREEAQPNPMSAEATKLKRESSTVRWVAVDTPVAIGSTSGWTPEDITLLIGEPLSRLGDNWLGNPFVALASLISAPSMTDVNPLPPKETMENMIYHILDVSIPVHCFKCTICSFF